MPPIRLRDALTAVLVALLLYVAAYYVLLLPRELRFSLSHGGGGGVVRLSGYRFGGKVAEVAFQPMYQLDRVLRPHYWKFRSTRAILP